MRKSWVLVPLVLCAACSSVVPYRVPRVQVAEVTLDFSALRPGASLVTTTETIACRATVDDSPGAPLYPVVVSNKVGYINRLGETVIPPSRPFFFRSREFHDGLAPFLDPPNTHVSGWDERSYRYGVMNRRGEVVFEPYLSGVSDFSGGTAVAWCGPAGYGHYALLDKAGTVRHLSPGILRVDDFREGLATVAFAARPQGVCGCMDRAGRLVIAPRFSYVGGFNEGLAAAEADGKWGYIDTNGVFVIEPAFDEASSFSEGMARVTRNQREFFIDRTGHTAGSESYDAAGNFKEGLACVAVRCSWSRRFRWTFVDTRGKAVMPWRRALTDSWWNRMRSEFSEGLAAVPLDDEMVYIDKKGTVVLRGQYTYARDFRGGLAWVATKTEYGYIDKNGKFVWRRPRSANPQP